MHALTLHPSCDPGPVRSVEAEVEATANGWRVRYRVAGDLSQIVWPCHTAAKRAEGLWRTTCFELFWQAGDAPSYTEVNLSPSSRWAAWRFSDYREGARDAQVDAISIATSASGPMFEMVASAAMDAPLPAKVGLTAVIEPCDAPLQYWATAFPHGKPDFHAGECRTIRIEDHA